MVQTDGNQTLKLLSPDSEIPGQESFVSYLLTLNGHWLEMSTVIDASVSKAFPIVVRADSYGKMSG